ncbi:hypothetical protein J4444_01905 [Candidatus Woesearchaeota archaeon]|nr:hypothetical protein [Candidatus Woesearchaeota archaeon]
MKKRDNYSMNSEKDKLSRTFDYITYILNYIYKDISSTSKDILTEVHYRFFRYNHNPNKKILGYWDFNQRLSRFGDFMTFLEYLSMLSYEFKLNPGRNIDLCFIDDDTHYNKSQPRFNKTYLFKKNLKKLWITNPNIDSVFSFKSNAEFEKFYSQNKDRYIRWPPTVSGTVVADCRVIDNFHKNNGFIPHLDLPKEILAEVYSFYESNIYPALPIVLNVRKNSWDASRNSDSSHIYNFIKHYEQNKRYKFIIICNKEEISEEFRLLKNVIFSKDYSSDVEFDLGLIKISYLSIFPSSGMACFAWFSKTPFIQYGNHGYQEKFTATPKGKSFSFLSVSQKIYHEPETTEKLISWFESMVGYLESNKINNNELNKIQASK